MGLSRLDVLGLESYRKSVITYVESVSDRKTMHLFILGGRSLINFSALAVSLTTKVTRKRAVRALNLTLSLFLLILMATGGENCVN